MAKYFLTKKAIEDLSKIWDYTCATILFQFLHSKFA
jgi:plasmid stabilization system protein ParE